MGGVASARVSKNFCPPPIIAKHTNLVVVRALCLQLGAAVPSTNP